MNCAKCHNAIPVGRLQLGFKVCVDCSTAQPYGCIDVVYHKTGNTIEVTTQEHAQAVRNASKRMGFGIMRGMRPGKTTNRKIVVEGATPVRMLPKHATHNFDQVGADMMTEFETNGVEAANKLINKQYADFQITLQQRNQLADILKSITPKEVVVKVNMKAYSKQEVTQQPPSEIDYAFRNWKK